MTFPTYEVYRPSSVEWLGDLPQHWQVLRLKHACEVFPSNVDKHARDDEPAVRLCNYTDVYYNERITADMSFMEATASEEQIARFTLKAGDTIITKDSETADDIAIAAYVPEDLPGVVCGYHLSMVRPKGKTHGAFVKRLFDSIYAKAKFEVTANGLTRVGLGQYALDNVELPFPPPEEQQAIAAFLDRETAKIDALVEEQKRLIELLKEKRQAVISQAVTKGLDPNVPMKDSGVEWLGEVPAHWQVRPLKKCIAFQEGPGIMAADFQDDGIPLLRISCVQNEAVTLDGCNYLDPEKVARQWSHFRVEIGDLLISGSASMGVVSEVGEEAAGAVPYTGLMRLQGRHGGMLKDFIKHLVVSDSFMRQVQLLKTGSTIQHFGPTHLNQMLVVLPPEDEQEAIAKFLTSENRRMDSLCAEAEAGMALLQERRSALISAAVTGKIDVRGLALQPEGAVA